MTLTPEQRTMRARIAAHAKWARYDPASTARLGQAGLLAKFEREADPDGILHPVERVRRAVQLRKLHMQRLAFASSKARTQANADPNAEHTTDDGAEGNGQQVG